MVYLKQIRNAYHLSQDARSSFAQILMPLRMICQISPRPCHRTEGATPYPPRFMSKNATIKSPTELIMVISSAKRQTQRIYDAADLPLQPNPSHSKNPPKQTSKPQTPCQCPVPSCSPHHPTPTSQHTNLSPPHVLPAPTSTCPVCHMQPSAHFQPILIGGRNKLGKCLYIYHIRSP